MICLPRAITDRFVSALKSGELNPDELSKMSSEDRRAAIENVVGTDNAKDVNALFESKLALKDQQAGIISWIKETAGLKPEVQRDIISRVNKMTDVLNPADQKTFLNDLVAKKLGTEVTPDEAKQLSQLGKTAMEAKSARDTAGNTPETIRAYGKSKLAFGDYLDSLKPDKSSTAMKIRNVVSNILSIPKTLLTGILHLSAPFVQGWGMMSTPEFWKGNVEMVKYFGSEEAYQNARADILGHPDYDLLKSGGLSFTSIDGKLNDREEAIHSNLLQKAGTALSEKTGLPDVLRASSRGFTGFLNYVRFNRGLEILNAARLAGEDVSKGGPVINAIGDVVNNFTGRGNLGSFDAITPELNSVFFSPKKIAATIHMFNPAEYIFSDSPTARAAAIRQLTGSLVITGSMLGLAKLSGIQATFNPISTNFGKVKIGNSTFDMTGGNAAYVKLIAQLTTGKETSSSGKTTKLGSVIQTTSKTGKTYNTPFTESDRATVGINYLRDHLAPIAAIVADWAYHNTNVVGQPTTVPGEIKDEMTPLVLQSFIDAYNNSPDKTGAVLRSLIAIFGISVQTNAPITKKTK